VNHRIVVPVLACSAWMLGAACGSSSRPTETEPEVTPASPGGTLPLGTVSVPTALASCPQGFYPGSSCFQATVSCASTAPLRVTYGYRTPSGAVKGTVLMHDGGGGTTPFSHGPRDGRTFPESFFSAGYRVVQLAWASDWEDTGLAQKNVRLAACRPATLMKHVYETVHGGKGAPGGMGALGHSGGTGALGYALSWYGAGEYLDKAMFSSGPVFSDISKACEVPAVPIQICPTGQFGCTEGGPWTASPEVGEMHATEMRNYSGISSCSNEARPPTPSELDALRGMSIVDKNGSVFVEFPRTAVSAWLCTAPNVPAGPLGAMYFSHITSPSQVAAYSVNPVNNCSGEGTWNGTHAVNGVQTDAFALMVRDMTDPIVGCVKRH
jgi:hypothetical protein